MMIQPINKSWIVGFIVLASCLCLLYLDSHYETVIIDKQKSLLRDNLYKIKKEQITDVVSSVYLVADSTLNAEFDSHRHQLQHQLYQFQLILNPTSAEQRCQALQNWFSNEQSLIFSLVQHGQIMCQSTELQTKSADKADWQQNYLSLTTPINDEMELTLLLANEVILTIAKQRVAAFIRTYKLQNPDTYVWVNEIINYQGGDDYAVRKVHPNLSESEGLLLSTNMQDIKGNFPYLEELEGINKAGEVYFEYYFKQKTNDEIAKKLTYAKLFEPFNWIIATGVYIENLELTVNKEINKSIVELDFYNRLIFFVALCLFALFWILLSKIEREKIKRKEQELTIKHQQTDVKNYRQVLSSMLELVERRDSYTAGHTRRVAQYAVAIAKAMGFSEQEVDMLYESAIMHDIGKISTPDSILLKPGKLTAQEYKMIQKHLDSGYKLLSSIKAFKKHAEIIRNHHEHYDGTGYPRGLKGEDICPLSHILILVDAFDAMTSKRIYRLSKSKADSIAEIQALAGKQFCPDTVKAAIPVLEAMDIIPVDHNYLKDEFEEARLAYYYKDPLTGLYNYRYLEHILSINKDLFGKRYHCCYFVNLLNYSQYNQQKGWQAGDDLLCRMANKLTEAVDNAAIFRVFGDDFLILTEQYITLDSTTLEANLKIAQYGIELELHYLDLQTDNICSLVDFSKIINQFIDESKRNRKAN